MGQSQGAEKCWGDFTDGVMNVWEKGKDWIAIGGLAIAGALKAGLGKLALALGITMGIGLLIGLIIELTKDKEEEKDDYDVGDIPYHISIQFDGKHLCSGTLIHKKYVLTLASCVAKYEDEFNDKAKLKIYVGEKTVPNSGTFYRVERVKVHPDFDYTSHNSDIGLLRLMEEVKVSAYSKPVNLPYDASKTPEGLEMIVSGYDNSNQDNSVYYRRDLFASKMKISSFQNCEEKFIEEGDMSGMFCAVPSPRYRGCVVTPIRDLNRRFIDKENTLTLGLLPLRNILEIVPNEQNFCMGNPGSPATVKKTFVIGIYARRGECLRKTDPELFIRIPTFLKFIRSAMD